MAYKLIIFDLGGVVLKFDHHISARKIASRFALDEKHAYDLFFDSGITKPFDEGRLTPFEFHRRVEKLLKIRISYNDFKAYWQDIFFTNPGIGSLIKRLKKTYKVYLLSNTNKLHFDFIRKKFGIIREFDRIILSYKVGVRKPDPLIYRCALKAARVRPDEAVFIDDRPELVEGARSIGITGILFKEIARLKKELNKILLT